MFTPLHLLPQYDLKIQAKYQERWDTEEGGTIRDVVLEKIKAGGGEDFLQEEYERGRLGLLETMWDLKGLRISGEIDFPKGDNFEGIDFSYAVFANCKFRNACFPGTVFRFTKFCNCEFIDCIFVYTGFFAATLEKTVFRHCDFMEHNNLLNCDCRDVKIIDCFMSDRIFLDSRFDELSDVGKIRERSVWESILFKKENLAEIYKGIKDAYKAGNAIKQSRQYFYKERKSLTRYNSNQKRKKIAGYFLELFTGYGVMPLRVLSAMAFAFIGYSSAFIFKIGATRGILLSAGAFFTFGANTQYIQDCGMIWKLIYILEAFSGISLMALFVTVLANYWFSEK
jgi:hypothetical protein